MSSRKKIFFLRAKGDLRGELDTVTLALVGRAGGGTVTTLPPCPLPGFCVSSGSHGPILLTPLTLLLQGTTLNEGLLLFYFVQLGHPRASFMEKEETRLSPVESLQIFRPCLSQTPKLSYFSFYFPWIKPREPLATWCFQSVSKRSALWLLWIFPKNPLRASFLLKSRRACIINYSKDLTGQGCHWHIHTQ